MSSRDVNAQVVEQFLRTMAPPASLTATYRQRVVRASLDARGVVLRRRRVQRLIVGLAIGFCALMAPAYAVVVALSLWILPAFPVEGPIAPAPPVLSPMQAAVDGYELAVIQTQFQARAEAWLAAQQGGER